MKDSIETKFYKIDLPATLKSLDELKGEFTAYASTYSLDKQDDKVVHGAFARTIAEAKEGRAKRGDQFLFPILYSHDVQQPIGAVIDAFEDDQGLKIRGFIDLDIPEGKRAFSGMAKGYLSGLSIGYKARRTSRGTYGTRNLEDIELLEISVVTFPANTEARVLAVKTAGDVNELALEMIAAMRQIAAKYALGGKDVATIKNPLSDDGEEQERPYGFVLFQDGEPGETRQDVIRQMQAEARREDDIFQLHGRAYDREVEARRKQKEQKQRMQREALEAERKEAAARQAAQTAPSFTPASFAAAFQLDEQFVRGRFTAWVLSGLVVPIEESTLTLSGIDARQQAKREWERFEARYRELAFRKAQGEEAA